MNESASSSLCIIVNCEEHFDQDFQQISSKWLFVADLSSLYWALLLATNPIMTCRIPARQEMPLTSFTSNNRDWGDDPPYIFKSFSHFLDYLLIDRDEISNCWVNAAVLKNSQRRCCSVDLWTKAGFDKKACEVTYTKRNDERHRKTKEECFTMVAQPR